MEIDTKIILKVVGDLLNRLEKTQGSSKVSIDKEYYWNVPLDKVNDPYTEPEKLSLGSVSDDLERLQHVNDNTEDAVSHDLVIVSRVLRTLGTSCSPF